MLKYRASNVTNDILTDFSAPLRDLTNEWLRTRKLENEYLR